jgi:3-isopropylmalate/(R)-2-methylmalate dehydratase small subunit
MRPFTPITAVAAPLLRDHIDTDAIIPSREIKSVSKTGLAEGLFAGWRYLAGAGREANPEFVLNDPHFGDARILLAGANFGCGSSREHAVWALAEYGFQVLIASSFNPIFFRNCVRNGVLPAAMTAAAIAEVAAAVAAGPREHPVTVDLEAQTVRIGKRPHWPFTIPAEARAALLSGLDAIDATLALRATIEAFRAADRRKRPWVYGV